MDPTVSVIVTNHNGGARLRDCVESLLALDYPAERLQIVLVDDGSARWLQTAGLPGHFQRVWHGEHRGPAAARETGLRWATGEVVIPLDGNRTVSTDFVRAHLAAAGQPGHVLASPNLHIHNRRRTAGSSTLSARRPGDANRDECPA